MMISADSIPRARRSCPPSRSDQHPLLSRFKGAVLIAPAIQGNPPPPPVVAILRYVVAPLIPKTQIPDMLESGKATLGGGVPGLVLAAGAPRVIWAMIPATECRGGVVPRLDFISAGF